jgi:phosphoglycolate phosphatase-like HAD superfamily hydrolase
MNNLKCVVFDFDGTIADTLDLSLKIYNRIAPEYNLKSIGQGELDLLRAEKPQKLLKAYGVTNLKLFLLLLRMRKELGKHIPGIRPVEGIRDSLYEIKNAGYKLGILTSNSMINVSRFLENNDLSGIFDFIYSSKSLLGKDRTIRRMLEIEKLLPGSVVYVGDETRDVEASKKSGIPVIAVSWGLHTREILASVHPDHIIDRPDEIFKCVQIIFVP